jgi:Uncharacterized protein conserved in bacteria
VQVDFERLDKFLRRESARAGTAESHGTLYGLLCTGKFDAARDWINELLNSTSGGESEQAYTELFASLCEDIGCELNDPSLSLRLLLPDDSRPLSERMEALAEWCQGFLFGLGHSACDLFDSRSGDIKEILRDIAEIGRVDVDVQEGDEMEAAYTEVVEYVRIGVSLIAEELSAFHIPRIPH